jgi:release factor glutamine methyltransferase
VIQPKTIGSTLNEVSAALAQARFDEPRRLARRLVGLALGLTPEEVFARLDRVIGADEEARVAAALRRALTHEPLSRIRGSREFWGLDFALSPDTLDPRPETETLVEAVIARLIDRGRPYRFLDLGTGSGCLLVALLSEYSRATGIGVDRAFDAVAAAKNNASTLGVGGRAAFLVGDWAAALTERFDVIVANPPYVASAEIAGLPPEVRDFDPRAALDGGSEGLDAYRVIGRDLPRLLTPSGAFACEIGAGQDKAVAEILTEQGLTIDEIVADLAGIPRCVVARAPA